MNFQTIYEEFKEQGYAIIPSFLLEEEVISLKEEISEIVHNMNLPDHLSTFDTEKNEDRDEYFLQSGDKISYFFEKDAVDKEGKLVVEKDKSLNKMGHALHWLNPVFKKITFSNKIKELLRAFHYKAPAVVQSMVIFKHPGIGGEVTPHQDSTFLRTEPLSTIGIWIPLVDVTLNNGCLWFIPGSHKGEVYQRFVRNYPNKPLLVLKGEMPHFDESLYKPVLVKRGDCVVIHGSVIHKSGLNLSNESRLIYTFHVIEKKDTVYSEENWLQPTQELPFPSVYPEST